MASKVQSLIKLMRPKHYLKNVLVFLPIVYSQNILNLDKLFSVILCFIALCLVASGIYAVNDIADCEKDKEHPINKTRPVASGQIKKPVALVFALFLFALGFLLMAVFGGALVLFIAALYVLLNLAYSFKLKHYALIDCFCISASFVLRVYLGGAVIGEVISDWLFLTITAGSLFMAFGKRRGELIQVGNTDAARKVLGGYNLGFLNGIIFTCSGICIIFYSLWAMLNGLIYTVPLAIFIVFRYLFSIYNGVSYGDPITVIYGDKMLLAAISVFGVLSMIFLYGLRG